MESNILQMLGIARKETCWMQNVKGNVVAICHAKICL